MFFGEGSIAVGQGVDSKGCCTIGFVEVGWWMVGRVGWLDCSTLSFYFVSFGTTKLVEVGWNSTMPEYSSGNLFVRSLSVAFLAEIFGNVTRVDGSW